MAKVGALLPPITALLLAVGLSACGEDPPEPEELGSPVLSLDEIPF